MKMNIGTEGEYRLRSWVVQQDNILCGVLSPECRGS
jgi:hypothetical protein